MNCENHSGNQRGLRQNGGRNRPSKPCMVAGACQGNFFDVESRGSTRGTHVADGHTQCGEAWHVYIKCSDREVGFGAEASSLNP